MTNPLSKFLTIGGDKRLRNYKKAVQKINDLEPSMQAKTDAELRSLADALRERANNGEALDTLLPEAFALMREASVRTIGLRHYDVQLIGGMALNDGCIAEMKTGEGKTLVSTATGFLNALDGSNVHVVTVNDYLAKRDSEWIAPVYGLLGMDVGVLLNELPPWERFAPYRAAVTYGTNSEFGFDYLRDNMVTAPNGRVQRGHRFAIVDEVDSILIDEARTPLIISGQGDKAAETYVKFAEVVRHLDRENDIVLDEAKRTVYATEEGLDRIEELLGTEVYADVTGALANHLKQALRAEFLFKINIDYIVTEGEVKIVDEFTGRIMEGRRFSEGLHQALEAKEGVEIKDETHTLATVTLQNYFRMYDKLAGMTGTAVTEDSEFRQIYKLPVVVIPTNKPVIREDKADLIFLNIDAKYKAVAEEVKQRHEKGQPVLVGTSSIEGSERLSALLRKSGVPHEVLNAKNHELEARIVAQAGRLGAVTIATNMAGRGTDILLGGNKDFLKQEAIERYRSNGNVITPILEDVAEKEATNIVTREGRRVRQLGGLCVIGTDRHESRRIDNQLRGRSGRQGDPGESQFYLSLEDNLLRLFGGNRLDAVSNSMKKHGLGEDEALQDDLVTKVINTAQHQVETMHFAARKNVLEYDDVMNLQRKAIYAERDAILDGKEVLDLSMEIARDLIESELALACPVAEASDDWDFKGLNAWFTALTGAEGFDGNTIDHDDDPDVLLEAMVDVCQGLLDKRSVAFGHEEYASMCKQVMLRMIDTHWIEHLTDMDHLKSGIGLRAIGHRDPLVEYKEEAYDAFGALTTSIYEDYLRTIVRIPLPETENEEDVEAVEDAVRVMLDEANPFDPSKMVYSNAEENLSGSGAKGLDRPL